FSTTAGAEGPWRPAAWARRLPAATLTAGGLAATAYLMISRDGSASSPTFTNLDDVVGLPALTAAFAALGIALLLSAARGARHRIWAQFPVFPVLWVSLLAIMTR